MRTTTKYLSNAMLALSTLEAILAGGNLELIYRSSIDAVNALRYAPEDNDVWVKLNVVCDGIEEYLLGPGALQFEGLTPLFAQIMSLMNSALRYDRSEALFSQRGWTDPNNHSFYRRTFAESRLGMGIPSVSDDCGVRFYGVRDLFKGDCAQAFDLVVAPLATGISADALQFHEKPDKVFLLSMNGDYLEKFGVAQACSLLPHIRGSNVAIVFIVFDADEQCVSLVNQFIAAAAKSGVQARGMYSKMPQFPSVLDRNTYLASIRFALVYRLLEELDCTVVVTDADQLFQKGIQNIVNPRTSAVMDVSLFDHTCHYPFTSLYSKFGASYVEFYSTPRSHVYARVLSRFLAVNLYYRASWTVDQFALLYCRNLCPELRLHCIDNELIGDSAASVIWNMAGPAKNSSESYSNARRSALGLLG